MKATPLAGAHFAPSVIRVGVNMAQPRGMEACIHQADSIAPRWGACGGGTIWRFYSVSG
jgi:hypothetical protein